MVHSTLGIRPWRSAHFSERDLGSPFVPNGQRLSHHLPSVPTYSKWLRVVWLVHVLPLRRPVLRVRGTDTGTRTDLAPSRVHSLCRLLHMLVRYLSQRSTSVPVGDVRFPGSDDVAAKAHLVTRSANSALQRHSGPTGSSSLGSREPLGLPGSAWGGRPGLSGAAPNQALQRTRQLARSRQLSCPLSLNVGLNRFAVGENVHEPG